MTNVNIFDSVSPNSGEFFKFKAVGDAVQGTYVDKSEGTDSFGNDQIIYVIKDSDSKTWNVAFRKDAAFVNERMAGIRLGQIVGFRFDEERDSKKMPGKKAKIIRIYADAKFVDNEWLAAQKNLDFSGSHIETTTPISEESEIDQSLKNVFEAPKDAVAASGVLPEDVKEVSGALAAVRQLAITKGLTSELDPEHEQDGAIENFAKMDLNEANMTKIIIALTGFVK